MGILKKSVSAKSSRSAITIIAEGNKFNGDMSIIGKMHIDGMFDGIINSLDNLSIGKAGHVTGSIQAKQITVSGLLEGEVVCDELHIEKGGQVRATVFSKMMSIDPAGCFLGERRQHESGSARAIAVADCKADVEAVDTLPDKMTLSADSDD